VDLQGRNKNKKKNKIIINKTKKIQPENLGPPATSHLGTATDPFFKRLNRVDDNGPIYRKKYQTCAL
jgi:hypothetical protein